jgi:hypothetical protein
MWAEEIAPDVFGTPHVFQDSAGVPCVVRKLNTDTIYCVFQWFRAPRTAPTWDRVAVKMSVDNGMSWTEPVPIVVDGMPTGWQRPFDPTIVCYGDSIRIFFSSSVRMPMGGLDSIVNTYSAVGVDGIHYTFEQGARFDHATRPVIDPAATIYRGQWHYTAPIGAPQEGAYQATSMDGREFTRIADIASDNQHNWTGNLLVDENDALQFYGSGPTLWRATYEGEGRWGRPTSIGLKGGDPSAVTRRNGAPRMIIYVGPRYVTDVADDASHADATAIASFVVRERVSVGDIEGLIECVDVHGNVYRMDAMHGSIDVSELPCGFYLARRSGRDVLVRFIKVGGS